LRRSRVRSSSARPRSEIACSSSPKNDVFMVGRDPLGAGA
jgi:hypothetical protein